ncbi:MAG TPA: hypothetical protein VIV12_05660 [Streptosporangiaceae bacterium]
MGAHSNGSPQAGRAVAVLFTKTYGRVLGPGLATLHPQTTRRPSQTKPARPGLERPVLDRFIDHALARHEA